MPRLLVERVFAQYMVPHNLETSERMKCLYYLYATLDTNAVKYVFLTRVRSKAVGNMTCHFLSCLLGKKKLENIFLDNCNYVGMEGGDA